MKLLLADGELDEDSGKSLLDFINCEEAEILFAKETLSQEKMQRKSKELLERFSLLKKRREEGDKPIDERKLWGYEREYYALKKKYGGNEEGYKDEFYKKAKKYIVFYYMLAEKCKVIGDNFEKKVCYKRYGKHSTNGNYYNESVIRDLVVSNVSRGSLYKRTPKSLCNKAEYEYREDGALIIYKWYAETGEEYFTEVYFQSEDCIYSFRYDRAGGLNEVGIRKYEKEKIIHSEYARIHVWDSILCHEIHSEPYRYFNNELCEAFWEEYQFPFYVAGWDKQMRGFLTRRQYIFESDEHGYLKGYFVKEWWGDRIKENSGNKVLLLLSDKKRKDTRKDAGRWRRPNYFVE